MLIATWVLAVATSLGAMTGLVAVVTWRDNKRRERETQQADKWLDQARKEFAAKESVDNRTAVLVIGAVLAGMALWDKFSKM
jgi:hypothetical protein